MDYNMIKKRATYAERCLLRIDSICNDSERPAEIVHEYFTTVNKWLEEDEKNNKCDDKYMTGLYIDYKDARIEFDLLIGSKQSLIDIMLENFDIDYTDRLNDKEYNHDGLVTFTSDENDFYALMWIDNSKPMKYAMTVVVHESTHMAIELLNHHKIDYSGENQEVLADAIELIFSLVSNEYIKYKSDRCLMGSDMKDDADTVGK